MGRGVEPLRRAHWAELVLLFISVPSGSDSKAKCAAAGIDDGLESEEALCRLMNSALGGSAAAHAWVARLSVRSPGRKLHRACLHKHAVQEADSQ